MILPTEIADELLSLPLLSAMTVSQPDNGSSDDQVSDDDLSVSEPCVVDVDHINESSVHAVTSDADLNADGNALINEQYNDKSLAGCHALAAAGKGNFEYRNGVLYRGDRIFGQRIWQLVVPQGRREHVLKLAHETGAHLGIRKTSERMRMSFWWNGLKQDVQKFVNSCHSCQLYGVG